MLKILISILIKIKNFLLNILYNTPRILFINFYKYCVVKIRVFDPKKIPKDSSAIFAFNHTTGADPIIVLGALKRKIYFLADSDRFRSRFTDFFFRKFTNSIPLFKKEFTKNIKSFKEIFDISKNKKIFFGIFPEGELRKNGKFGKFRDGAAYLSYKTKLPIIPVYIHNIHKGPNPNTWCGKNPICEGIYSLFSNAFRKINVFIGQPINPIAEEIYKDFKELTDKKSYKKLIEKLTSRLESEFLQLKEEAENLASIKKQQTLINTDLKYSKSKISKTAAFKNSNKSLIGLDKNKHFKDFEDDEDDQDLQTQLETNGHIGDLSS